MQRFAQARKFQATQFGWRQNRRQFELLELIGNGLATKILDLMRLQVCYLGFMKHLRFFVILCLSVRSMFAAQVPADKSATAEPVLPVIDYKACPFEGCSFRKWVVSKDVQLYSTWKGGRKTVATLKSGQVVTGLTGVHITYEPDRVQVLQPLPKLRLQAGDIILRYMYRGEGFADIWAKGKWRREYDCTFIAERDNAGCLRDCSAKVIAEGRKDWWVRVKTSEGLIGWAKAEDQFDCMDSLVGDSKCDNLDSSSSPSSETPTSIDVARTEVEANLHTPEGKAYDAKLGTEFTLKHSDTARLCEKPADGDTGNFWMLLKLDTIGSVTEVLLYPTTELGACVRETMLNDSFSPPRTPPTGWAFT
jgi:hypothetical protein